MFDSSSNKIKLKNNIDYCKSILKENIYENITNINDELYNYNTIFIEKYGKYYSLQIIDFQTCNKFLPHFLINKFKYKEYKFFYIKGIERLVKPLDLLIADYIRQSQISTLNTFCSTNPPIDSVLKNIYFPKTYDECQITTNTNSYRSICSQDSLQMSIENDEICYEYDGIMIKNKAYVKKWNLYDKTYHPLMKKIDRIKIQNFI